MTKLHAPLVAIAVACCASFQQCFAECAISEQSRQLDPVEVGYCEADVVFVGKVDTRMETIRAYTEEGANRTKHYRIETSTVRVLESIKGKLPEKVTTIADLYDKKTGAFSFENGKEYLVFAKRLPAENEYAAASAACSVQPTLLLSDAHSVREQLEQHRKGTQKIDCKNIRSKKS